MKEFGWLGKNFLEKGLILFIYIINAIVFVLLFDTRYSVVFSFLGVGVLLVKVLFDGILSYRNQLRLTLFIFEFGVFYGLILLQRLLDLWAMQELF